MHFRFLDLPLEIRYKVYHELLSQSEVIEHSGSDLGLHPAILRTSRQVHDEARIVLYMENYFGMRIFKSNGGERAYFLRCDCYAQQVQYKVPSFRSIRSYDIYVEIQDKKDFSTVKKTIRDVCMVLSEVTRIKHLIITLGEHPMYISKLEAAFVKYESQVKVHKCFLEMIQLLLECATVLQPFTLLRNVGRVEIRGVVKPVYKQYLIDIMQGCDPLTHLPKMYHALQDFAGPFDCFQEDHRDACKAMEDDDVEDFKRIRATLIEKVTAYMQNAQARLFDYDDIQQKSKRPSRSEPDDG